MNKGIIDLQRGEVISAPAGKGATLSFNLHAITIKPEIIDQLLC